jgi:hypothetical protein
METNEHKLEEENTENGFGKGRPKGSVNKSTKVVREAIAELLNRNSAYMDRWLQRVAEGDEVLGIKADPYKALDIMLKMSEYHIPKLARTELTGVDGEAIQHSVTWQK